MLKRVPPLTDDDEAARAPQPAPEEADLDDPLVGDHAPRPPPDDHLALVAPADAEFIVDAALFEAIKTGVLVGTDRFSVDELELLSADMCAIVNARRLDWDRTAMLDVSSFDFRAPDLFF